MGYAFLIYPTRYDVFQTSAYYATPFRYNLAWGLPASDGQQGDVMSCWRLSEALLCLIALDSLQMTGHAQAQATNNEASPHTALPRVEVRQVPPKRHPASRPHRVQARSAPAPDAAQPSAAQPPTALEPPLGEPSGITGVNLSPSAAALPATTTRIDSGPSIGAPMSPW